MNTAAAFTCQSCHKAKSVIGSVHLRASAEVQSHHICSSCYNAQACNRLGISHIEPPGGKSPLEEKIPSQIRGWWRIIDTATWINERLDVLGPALVSFTGYNDRLRMHCLLAQLEVKGTKTGISFSWKGAWEYDQLCGTGSARVNKNGMLKGIIKIKNGDSSSFSAERYEGEPSPIPDPPSYRDKWKRRW